MVLGVSVVGLLAALTVAVSLGWKSPLTLALLSAALVFGLATIVTARAPALAAYLAAHVIGGGLCVVGAVVVLFTPRRS